MLNYKTRFIILVLVLISMFLTLTTVSAANTVTSPESATLSAPNAPSAAPRCYYGSKVWADGKNYGIRIWREWLEFDWCHDGRAASVSRVNHWFQISYPFTQVAWQNQSVSPGPNGSQIVFVHGEVEFRWEFKLGKIKVPVVLRKYSAIKLQVAKNGKVSKIS
ncbi:MAG: hypothetical protein K8J31_28060 [Anaerolineae bacterium]|nr:hypothetical protein [Anaerolineae bacterium]